MYSPEVIVLADSESFVRWSTSARKGESVVYYRGWLMKERMKLHPHEIRGPAAFPRFQIANKAWEFMELGVVHLFQKRLGDDDYLYVAVKS